MGWWSSWIDWNWQLFSWRHYCHGPANNVTVLVGNQALPICEYFEGAIKSKPTTLSLTVLALIEMFNALNALSDHMSLFKIGIFGNMYLIWAIGISMGLHCVTLYLPVARLIFATSPLTCNDWILCTLFALPVFAIEEVIKYVDRNKEAQKELKLFKQKTL